MTLPQRKPFNPILGETYEAFWPNGTKIYAEHTSHHPPIMNFFVYIYFFNSIRLKEKTSIIGDSTNLQPNYLTL